MKLHACLLAALLFLPLTPGLKSSVLEADPTAKVCYWPFIDLVAALIILNKDTDALLFLISPSQNSCNRAKFIHSNYLHHSRPGSSLPDATCTHWWFQSWGSDGAVHEEAVTAHSTHMPEKGKEKWRLWAAQVTNHPLSSCCWQFLQHHAPQGGWIQGKTTQWLQRLMGSSSEQ